MEEIKTDLFPSNLRAAKNKTRQTENENNKAQTSETPPESESPRQDGSGGERFSEEDE